METTYSNDSNEHKSLNQGMKRENASSGNIQYFVI